MSDAAVSAMLAVAPSVREAGMVTEPPSVREAGTATEARLSNDAEVDARPSMREAGSTAAPTVRDAAASAVTTVIDQGQQTASTRRQRPTLSRSSTNVESFIHVPEPYFNMLNTQRRAEAAIQAATAQIAEIAEFRRETEAQITNLIGQTSQQAQQLASQSNELDLGAARNQAASRRVAQLESDVINGTMAFNDLQTDYYNLQNAEQQQQQELTVRDEQIRRLSGELLDERIESSIVYDSLQADYHNLQTAEERAQQQLTQLTGEFLTQSINLEDSKARTRSQIRNYMREKVNVRKLQAMMTRQIEAAQNDRFAARSVAADYQNALARSDRALQATEVAARGYQKEAFDAAVKEKKRARKLPIIKTPKRKLRWTSAGQTL